MATGLTPNYALHYPLLTDPVNVAGDVEQLADDVDTVLLTKANLTSPTFITPILGVATGTSFNSITGLSSTTPVVDGTAAVGTATTTARADHVHPTDTSRAALASPTFTGQVTVPAGTTSAAPVIFQSGSLLTSAAGGRMEYDGKLHYLTPSSTAVGGRGVVQTTHYFALNGDRTITNNNSAQSIFGVGLTVQGTTTYDLEMVVAISSTGTNSNSLGISFGGTATLTSIAYQVESSQNATSLSTLSSGSQTFITTASNTAVTAAVATATYRNVLVKGTVRINGSGTFIPQITYSAVPGAAPVVASNSFIKMTPVGTNTVTAVGAWA